MTVFPNSPVSARTLEVCPDAAGIAEYFDTVFAYCEGFVPIRLLTEKGTPTGPPWTSFLKTGQTLARTMAFQARRAFDAQRALFVVPGTVAKPGSAKTECIIELPVVVVDIDDGCIGEKRDHLVMHLGEPSLEIASGGLTELGEAKRHLYWRLTEPARDDDIAVVCRIQAEIASKAGGDPSFKSAHQPIRVPGSIHGKHGVRSLVRILNRANCDRDLREFAEAVSRMPPLPGLTRLEAPDRTRRVEPSAIELKTTVIREGGADVVTRFDALSKVIGHWLRQVREGNISLDEAWKAVDQHNAAMIAPPWPDDRLRRDFEALCVLDTKSKGPFPIPTLAEHTIANDVFDSVNPVSMAPATSEDAIATIFAESQAQRWRYVAVWGTWLGWTGQYWREDEMVAIREAVRQTCRSVAIDVDKPHEARRIASNKTITSTLQIVASDPAFASLSTGWDSETFALNCKGGEIDLRSGEINDHDPKHLMTRFAPVSPASHCPRWTTFIFEITAGDAELAAYLKRLCGYCLTGSTQEQVFFFLYGNGSNGKSVFLNALRSVLGNYAATAALDTFMSSQSDRHPTDLAGLRGARLVIVTETEPGRTWAESRIKAISGGDTIRARFMHRDYFEFTPSFKLIVAGNHRPHLTGVGEAMRRRLHLVPFVAAFQGEQRDNNLADALLAERDGILGWMLEGCLEWQAQGLSPPRVVCDAVQEYFEDEDLVGQWIAAQCRCGPEEQATAAELFTSWAGFADAGGHLRGSQKTFGAALRERGFAQARGARTRLWRGIALRRSVGQEA